jgi:methylmalonyl-CoA/ethylmalonyl-CoA epimerase
MKVNKIDHLCIAVKDLEAAQKVWEPILGKDGPDDPYVDELEMIKVARYWIEKRGEGIMLVGLNVDSTQESIDELTAKGYPFIGGARPFRDCEFAFIHPKAVNGVLLELIDYKWTELKDRQAVS